MISKTNKAVFAGALMALVMLAAGLVVVGIADESDAVPDPERAGVAGYPIAVFGEDGTSTGYQNLSDIRLVDGDEVWIYENLSGQGFFAVGGGRTITLHLHYSDLTFADNAYIQLYNGTLNIDGNGIITAIDPNRGYTAITMFGNADGERFSVLNVGSGITLVGYAGLGLHNNSNMNSGMVVDFAGKTTGSTLGISINGIVKKTDTDDVSSVINPHVPEITIRAGALIEGSAQGIYAAGYGIWNIDGATIIGGTGMEARAGEVYATNTTFIGTSTPTETAPNGSGTTVDGAGFAISQHTTKQYIDVELDSCKVSGYSAFYQANIQGHADDVVSRISIDIEGGEYTATNGGTLSVYSQNFVGFINSGTFSSDPSAYVVDGKNVILVGEKYCVGTKATNESNGVISTEDKSAVANVESPAVVIKVKDASFDIVGDDTLGTISVTAEKKTEAFIQAPTAVASYDITIVTNIAYVADITIDAVIPDGHMALVYYIDEDGELVPVEVVDYTSTTVTFRTTHNTPFVVMTEEAPSIPDYGDDDYNPVNPAVPVEEDDDSTKLVIAVAAVVVIMLAAVAMMMAKKN